MRKYHRWLSVFFGIFLLWISVTGVLSHIAPMVNRGSIFEDEQPAAAAGPPPGVPAGFDCPATMNCRPKPKPGGWNVGFLHHLHSGEQFGATGTVIALLSGIAMIFFSFSGVWMYIRMFRARPARPGQAKWFW